MSGLLPSTSARWIRPLPERVINKIAAGEVIERPAAVVKELVENAIDADAKHIEIIIEKSGAKLIKIVDDGCGIPEEQVEIAFSRHATSKIRSFEDLNQLYTYGFRGEALPSIASVSRMRMVTRTRESNAGTEIIYEGGVIHSKKPIAAPIGTLIEVENLFYNTPARRKFLKTETTEARQIARTAMGMAIGRCEIGFSFSMNDRTVFSLNSGGALGERISAVLGQDKKMISVNGEHGPLKVQGYIGTPEMIQQNRSGQFLFINNRLIQSPTIAHAFMAAYGELLPKGKYPIGALLLLVDVAEVDVNVHPTKAEVRLSRENEIHDAVFHIVRDSLRQDGIIPAFKTGAGHQPPGERVASLSNSVSAGFQSAANFIEGVVQPRSISQSVLKELYNPVLPASKPDSDDIVQVDRRTGEIVQLSKTAVPDLPSGAAAEGFRLVGRFLDLYLILQIADDLYIVDQHTAHERVLFEETMRKVESNSVEAQTLLFPVQIELNPEQMAIFDEASAVLNRSGFVVNEFGGKTINIEAVPAVMRSRSPEKIFHKILDDIGSLKKAGYDIKKAIAQSIACRSAVMAGDRLTDHEAIGLVSLLMKCENRYSCPHGRPTFVKISRQDLDKQFGRR